MPPPPPSSASRSAIYFGPFLVTPQVFHTTPHTFALVNLKPILPGHTLICPLLRTASVAGSVPGPGKQIQIPKRRLRDLSSVETADLFLTVRRVGKMLERVYGAEALTVAVQDGEAAGQTVVEHVHAHVIPRKKGDMDGRGGNDAVYDLLEGTGEGEGEKKKGGVVAAAAAAAATVTAAVKPDAGRERKARSEEEMNAEAEWLRGEMEKEMAQEQGKEEEKL